MFLPQLFRFTNSTLWLPSVVFYGKWILGLLSSSSAHQMVWHAGCPLSIVVVEEKNILTKLSSTNFMISVYCQYWHLDIYTCCHYWYSVYFSVCQCSVVSADSILLYWQCECFPVQAMLMVCATNWWGRARRWSHSSGICLEKQRTSGKYRELQSSSWINLEVACLETYGEVCAPLLYCLDVTQRVVLSLSSVISIVIVVVAVIFIIVIILVVIVKIFHEETHLCNVSHLHT